MKLKKFIPNFMRKIYAILKNNLIYKEYDNKQYWEERAKYWKSKSKDESQKAVLWYNQHYNDLFRAKQKKILETYVKDLPANSRILDVGCGVGMISQMVIDINPQVLIDSIDFEPMIDIAQQKVKHKNIRFIASSAENYINNDYQYDLIISSGSFSAIRIISKMLKALDNSCIMVKEGGIILMMDPFHKVKFLARVRYTSEQVIHYLSRKKLSLVKREGFIFWPYRLLYSNSPLNHEKIQKKFDQGEKIMNMLGPNYWADYALLVFKKT